MANRRGVSIKGKKGVYTEGQKIKSRNYLATS